MPKYVIPVTWMMYGKYEVEAENIVEALDVVFGDTPLPPDGEYLEDSLYVNEEDVNENNTLSADDADDLSTDLEERVRLAQGE
jgi:hypothetical protein